MDLKKNMPYYLVAGALFILLKYWFLFATNSSLAFLLGPVDALVSISTAATSVPTAVGYYHPRLNIIIDKSCSGFNFWILCFLVFTYPALKYLDKALHKLLAIPAALVFAYILTIFVNTSRIVLSVFVRQQTPLALAGRHQLIHQAIGIVTNLSFLIMAYYFTEKILTRKRHNAQLT